MTFREYIAQAAWRLRRPERFLEKLKLLVKTHQVRSLAELEKLVSSEGIDIIQVDLAPRIPGLAAMDGSPLILLQPGLPNPLRELTLAHELGHVHLHPEHLADVDNVSLPTVGGIKDHEADIFALLCLVGNFSSQEEMLRILRYVLTDPKNLRRWWGFFRYFLFYDLRIQIAQCLEAIFLRNRTQGAS
ncbi:MAG: ImmA/IrrE family metallo-endopeptidase [Nitrospira sp.]|nr:ImmA/IrrE family metallo-endopeptidase [Nitrospira sp.]